MLSHFAEHLGLMRAGVRFLFGTGAPTNAVTGAGDAGIGSQYYDTVSGSSYANVGTLASPVWQLDAGPASFNQATGTISVANIIGVGAGQFGHAAGVTMLAAVGLHNVVELESVIMNYDFIVAAYTAGGNITVNNIAGGAALTGLVSAANSVGAAADKSVMLVPLSTVGIPLVENGGLSLVSSAAFTQPGTAAGVIRWVANYRIHATGF